MFVFVVNYLVTSNQEFPPRTLKMFDNFDYKCLLSKIHPNLSFFDIVNLENSSHRSSHRNCMFSENNK